MEDVVAVVRGRRVEPMTVEVLRSRTQMFSDVVIDLGAGDGRWLYRHARAHPDRFCLGIDASADLLREVSRRALRRPDRGGLPNLMFVRAGLGALPGGLAALAGEVHVQYPWGSLLRAVLHPDGARLRCLAGLLRDGGLLRVVVNTSAIQSAIGNREPGSRDGPGLLSHLRATYATAGLLLRHCEVSVAKPESTWAGRLGQGRELRVIRLEAEKRWPPW